MNIIVIPSERSESRNLIVRSLDSALRALLGMTFALCLLCSLAFAASSQVSATARILVTKYTVGDNIRVLIETETPKDWTIEPPSEKTDVKPFELKNIEASPIARGKNRVRRTFILNVTAFEKGTLKFPPVKVLWRSPAGKTGEIVTEPIDVEIVSVGKRASDKDDIRAIKGPESFDGRLFWSSVAAIFAGLLFLLLAVKIAVRRLRQIRDDESAKPPHVRARLELERLKDKDLAAAGHARDHAAGTADVLRRYVERRFGVPAMEKTTAELMESMKQKSVDRTLIEKIRAFLERIDLIKFAKEEPTRADLESSERMVLMIVEESTPKEEPEGKKK